MIRPISAKDLTRAKFAWLNQLARDNRLPGAAMRVGVVLIDQYLNSASIQAWPGIEKIAADVNISASSVRRAVHGLEKCGHVRVEWTAGGKGKTNIYRPLIDGKPLQDWNPFNSANPSNSARETLANLRVKHWQDWKGNPYEGNPIKETTEGGLQPPVPQCSSSESEDRGSTLRRRDEPTPRVSYQIGESIEVEGEPCEITEVRMNTLSIIFNEGGAVGEVPRDPATGMALIDQVCWLGREYADDLDDDIPDDCPF